MNTKFIVKVLCGFIVIILTGCAILDSTKHQYIMRGQVLDVAGDEVYLCIGSKDGAAVGQEYLVYRFIKPANPNAKNEVSPYKKENTGTIKLTKIIDEHFAKAQVVTGDARVNYVVELK